MPSTSEYRYARYFEDWRARVEKVGNENYPPEARGRYYGSLRLTVAIRKDGSVVDTILEKSSGVAGAGPGGAQNRDAGGAVSAFSARHRQGYGYP